jgi:hypothetical protein
MVGIREAKINDDGVLLLRGDDDPHIGDDTLVPP